MFERKRSLSTPNSSKSPQNHTPAPERSETSSVRNGALEAIISASIFMLFFGTPLFFLNVTFQGMLFEKQIYFYFWLLIGIIAFIINGVTSGTLSIRRTPLDIPILLVWITGLISLFFSDDIWRSFVGGFIDPTRGFLALTAFVLAYYFFLSAATPSRIRLAFWAIVSAAFVAAVLSVLALFNLGVLPGWFPVSVMGSVTALGILLAAALPLFVTGVFLLASKSALLPRVGIGLLLVGSVADLVLLSTIFGYVPWVAVLIGIGVFLLFILSRIVRPHEKFTWLSMAVFIGALVVLMIGGTSLARISLPQEVYPSAGLSWEVAKGAVAEHPFFGVGPALYERAFSQYVPDSFFDSPYFQFRLSYAGGLPLEILSTAGAVGAIAMVLFGIATLIVGGYFLSRDPENNKLLSLGLWSALVIAGLGCLFTVSHGSILLVTVLLGILAVAAVLSESRLEEKFLRLSVKASPKFALAMSFISLLLMVGVAFVFVLMGRALVADVYAGIGARQQTSIEEGGSVSYFVRAANLNPREGFYYLRLGREFLALANQEAAKSEEERDTNAIVQYLAAARTAAERGRSLLPGNSVAQENLAVVYDGISFFDPGALELAKRSYEQFLEMESRNPEVYIKLGQLDLAEARRTEDESVREEIIGRAKEKFNTALEIREGYPVAHYQLALAEDLLGNGDEAIGHLEQAVAQAGVAGNLSYTFTLARAYQNRDEEGDSERAEALFRAILGVNDRELNALLNLAILYERNGERDRAIEAYEDTLEALPEEGSDQARGQIEAFIQNLREGRSNLTPQTPPPGDEPQPAPENPEEAAEGEGENESENEGEISVEE